MVVMQATIVLVEDNLAYRESFRLAIESLSQFVVVGEAGAAREAFPLIAEKSPDLAVVDFLLPDANGISLARELRRRRLRTKILVLGRMALPGFVGDAIKSGIDGFALKQEPLEVIIEAMSRVLEGERHLSPRLQQELHALLVDRVPASASLSAREREILFLLIEGMSSKEIAKAVSLSAKTVDAHRLRINRKLGIGSPADLARLLADHDLIAG
jgi:DNA-binding NarL/FixJ family response regulator